MGVRQLMTKRDVAKRLAGLHFMVEDGLVKIFRIVTPDEKTNDSIVLLEVNKDTVAAGIMPLKFDAVPARGIPYSSVIVEVTPEEFKKIKASKLPLPTGWQFGEEIPRDEAILAAK
jgi:hypothetical protein